MTSVARRWRTAIFGTGVGAMLAFLACSGDEEKPTRPDDARCVPEEGPEACKACCREVHAEASSKFQGQIDACACAEGEEGCLDVCADTHCASPRQEASAECGLCMGFGCTLGAALACSGDAACRALLECEERCDPENGSGGSGGSTGPGGSGGSGGVTEP